MSKEIKDAVEKFTNEIISFSRNIDSLIDQLVAEKLKSEGIESELLNKKLAELSELQKKYETEREFYDQNRKEKEKQYAIKMKKLNKRENELHAKEQKFAYERESVEKYKKNILEKYLNIEKVKNAISKLSTLAVKVELDDRFDISYDIEEVVVLLDTIIENDN